MNNFLSSKTPKIRKNFSIENKNSILNKFRNELKKSQSIIQLELERSKELKQKFLMKSRIEKELQELEKRKIMENLNPIDSQIQRGNNFPMSPIKENNEFEDIETPYNIIVSNKELFPTGINVTHKKINFQKKGNNLPPLINPNNSNINANNFLNQSIETELDFNTNSINENTNIISKSNTNTNIEKVLSNIKNKENTKKNNSRITYNNKSFDSRNEILSKINNTSSFEENTNLNMQNYTPDISSMTKAKPKFRIKTYKIKYVNNWNEKNQIPTSDVTKNLDFQSNIIIDLIKVLLDNMNFFKLHYIQGKEVIFNIK